MMELSNDEWYRRLEEEEEEEDSNALGSSEIIRQTLRSYGIFYLCAILSFEYLRRRYPRLYNTRSWVPGQQCELAYNSYDKLFSWIWGVYQVAEEDIFRQCGMDILCFLRALRFCRNLSIVGVLNALWLLPIYRTAKDSPETATVTDTLDLFTLANLPASSNRFAATVLAAYIMAMATMYLLVMEFKWYTYWRHKYLSQRTINNYAVYVYGIPKEFRTSHELAGYFRSCSSEAAVLEAHVMMDTPHLEKLQAERRSIVQRLEHSQALEKRQRLSMAQRELMKTSGERLDELNREIPRRIRATTAVNDRFRSRLRKIQPSKNLGANIQLQEAIDLYPAILEEKETMQDEGVSFESHSGNLYTPDNHIDVESTRETAWRRENGDESKDGIHTTNTAVNQELSETSKDVLDGDNSEFLSFFVPGAETLLQHRHTSPSVPTRQESDLTEADERDSDHAMPLEGSEAQFSRSDIEETSDIEAQTFGSQVVYVRDDSSGDENRRERENIAQTSRPGLDTNFSQIVDIEAQTFGSQVVYGRDDSSGDENRRERENIAQTSRPGLDTNFSQTTQGSRGSKNNTGSHRRSTLNSVMRGASVAGENISKGTKLAGQTIVRGSQMTKNTLSKTSKAATTAIATGSRSATATMKKAAKDMKVDKLVKHAGNFVPVVLNRGEGQPRPGGFVVFTNLYTVQTALQMIHHAEPYTMEVQEAPPPGDIFWRNVGMLPKKRRLGRLYSTSASAVLCFFWSIPTAVIASLTSVSTIKEELPKLGEMVDKYPWFEQVLIQAAPMLLLFLNEVLLPEVLKFFATWEGHVSASVLEASLFLKLSCFMIIQTFFVSAISGSIYEELTNILKNPEEIITLLSTSLPSQSSYFLQIMFASTFLLQGIELLRVYPLGCALLRRFVGPRATSKERRKAWMYIYTLEDPPEFWHAETFAQIQILYVMVLLVYAVIAPFTACALLFCFLLMEAGYRYQFIHNYPRSFDTGGRLWFTFIQFVLGSLLISELTLLGLLALKQSKYAGPAMAPLIVITVLYILYINGRHSVVMQFLPTRDCIEIDQANAKAGRTDFSFCRDEYLQPSLKKFYEVPEYEDDDALQRGR